MYYLTAIKPLLLVKIRGEEQCLDFVGVQEEDLEVGQEAKHPGGGEEVVADIQFLEH
jgi:hypothetical protein